LYPVKSSSRKERKKYCIVVCSLALLNNPEFDVPCFGLRILLFVYCLLPFINQSVIVKSTKYHNHNNTFLFALYRCRRK